GEPDWERQPNGTGPFTLQSWEDDQILILARHEAYYGRQPDLSHVAHFLGAAIPLSLYERDQIDLVGVGGGNLERAQDPNSPLNADLRLGVNMCTSYVTFDVTRPPFDDALVRQAFNYALDRQRLATGLYQGNVLPAGGLLPPGMPGYTGDVGGYDYDPEIARDLLRQAGYASGADLPPMTYSTAGYGSPGGLVTAIITMWQEALDVTVEPVLIDPFTYLDEIYAGNIGNIFTQGWCADYPDPENFLDVLFHSQSQQNLGGYASPSLDALVEEARVETDVTRRLALYQQAEQVLVDDAPAVFLNHSESAVLVKPWVRNYTLTPLGVAQWQYVELER
ncbi:MAG: ABC transporter substrate-binding protein, partial [Candidatus Promineifilaceae bacterium]|nr:ABC transporter substrate-binding protein [Candidatus Promineifilaceae bacterium]